MGFRPVEYNGIGLQSLKVDMEIRKRHKLSGFIPFFVPNDSDSDLFLLFNHLTKNNCEIRAINLLSNSGLFIDYKLPESTGPTILSIVPVKIEGATSNE